jgi:hypothetical protein
MADSACEFPDNYFGCKKVFTVFTVVVEVRFSFMKKDFTPHKVQIDSWMTGGHTTAKA